MLEKLLISELESWKVKLGRERYDTSAGALALFKLCDKDVNPIIHTLLQILITLPSTGASAERSFSTLKRIKTWLRNTTSEDRLNGLALMHIHNMILN